MFSHFVLIPGNVGITNLKIANHFCQNFRCDLLSGIAPSVIWVAVAFDNRTLVTNIAIQDTARTRLNMLNPDPGAVLYITP